MATFDPTQLLSGSAFIPGASFPTTAGIQANQVSDGYCNGAGTTRTGAGVTTLPLRGASIPAGSVNDGLSSNENHAVIGIRGATGNSNVSYQWTSQVLITVNAFVVAAATDTDYDITIFKTRRVA